MIRRLKYAILTPAALAVLLVSCHVAEIPEPQYGTEPPPSFSEAHGLKDAPFKLVMTPASAGGSIYYTLDGSEPTSKSMQYREPLSISHTTIIRAVETDAAGKYSSIATASYLFGEDILDLADAPEGYPDEWGPYSEISGTAKADYGMDQSMTSDPVLRARMLEGLQQIPVVSLVTDKGNLFNNSTDPDKGGIYIHTGAPVGDPTGRSWERPVSFELFGDGLDLTISCGIKIHGGHSRLAEKNPKHAFRLKFKTEYGPSKLRCPVFGAEGPSEFNTLTLKTFFGNSWQHWDPGNRSRAQYVRDMWARSASASLGMPYSRGRHVHVFINGMYWGMYCLSERIDENYCKSHFGGEKTDYDVLKVDEMQSNSVVADYGSYATYARLCALSGENMEEVEEVLDVDNFIDFMIINQYAGNTDWDYHNWFAVLDKKTKDGFRFLCWDSEGIFVNTNDNVLGLCNKDKPTGLFAKLIENPEFKRRFEARVTELSRPGGLLTTERTVEIWDSLYHSIDKALYLEAARWGDYRYSVHRYNLPVERYDVDYWYMRERNNLMSGYFPARPAVYLQQLRDKGWYE